MALSASMEPFDTALFLLSPFLLSLYSSQCVWCDCCSGISRSWQLVQTLLAWPEVPTIISSFPPFRSGCPYDSMLVGVQ